MSMFQLQYKNNSKTHTLDLELNNYQHARDLFDSLFDGELFEIREFVHQDSTNVKDDLNYIHSKTVQLKSFDNQIKSIRIPKIKKNVTDLVMENLIFSKLKFNGKKPKSLKITTKF